jgi:uncharacterized protein (DUF433 family)
MIGDPRHDGAEEDRQTDDTLRDHVRQITRVPVGVVPHVHDPAGGFDRLDHVLFEQAQRPGRQTYCLLAARRHGKDPRRADPLILDGKPCVRGTRLSVEFLLELVASGATSEQILALYPQLTSEGLPAELRCAAHALRGERTGDLQITA